MKFKLLLLSFLIALQTIVLPAYAKNVTFSNMAIEMDDGYVQTVNKADGYQFDNKEVHSTIFLDIIRHNLRDKNSLEDIKQGILSNNEKANNAKHKVICNKFEKINNQDVLHFVELVYFDTKEAGEQQKAKIIAVRDRYSFFKPKEIYLVTLMLPVQYYEKHKGDFNEIVRSISFKEPMRKVKVKGTKYNYMIPEYFIDLPASTSDTHVFYSGIEKLITAVMVESMEIHTELPQNIDNLSKEQLVRIEADTKEYISKGTRNKIRNWRFEYGILNGNKCLIYDYDEVTSHNKSYVFVDNGKFVSFDFGYPTAMESEYIELVNLMVNSISK